MKKKLLPLALAAAAGLTGVTAQAQMSLNSDGTGQLLMYPIYTANGGNDTSINLANTTDDYKFVKVRFSDAMNSQDSLDFHLYLSPKDHWSSVVTKNAATEGAQVITGDTSCTIPTSFAAAKPGVTGTAGQMSTLKYATGGAEADAINNGIDRTLEGHIEVIEMATITKEGLALAKAIAGLATAAVDVSGDAAFTAASAATRAVYLTTVAGTAVSAADKAKASAAVTMAANIKHVAGIPGDCSKVTAAWGTGGAFQAGKALETLEAPTGGMYGYGVIINVPGGSAAMFDAVAVDGFMDQEYHPAPGDDEPGLDDGVNVANITTGGAVNVFTSGALQGAVNTTPFAAVSVAAGSSSTFHVSPVAGRTGSTLAGGGSAASASGSKEALSALLMRTSISNDYVLEPVVDAATDWVVTFPTKRDFVNMAPRVDSTHGTPASADIASTLVGAAQFKVEAPFSALWNHATTKSCDQITIGYTDREEATQEVQVTDIGFSPKPLPGEAQVTGLCTEVNILNFNGKGVLGGSTRITTDTPLDAGFVNGWATVSFANGTLTGTATTVTGKPVIGFAIQRYVNGAAGGTGVLANYAGSIGHHYTSDVQ